MKKSCLSLELDFNLQEYWKFHSWTLRQGHYLSLICTMYIPCFIGTSHPWHTFVYACKHQTNQFLKFTALEHYLSFLLLGTEFDRMFCWCNNGWPVVSLHYIVLYPDQCPGPVQIIFDSMINVNTIIQ